MEINDAIVRSAVEVESAVLSDLAFRSKASWGYDAAFMEACRAELTLTPAYIRANPTYVLEFEARPLGIYSFEPAEPEAPGCAELGLFFVEPACIGRGAGRRMMKDAMEKARSHGISRLIVKSDPQAEPFYRAMGFARTGEDASESFPERRLPVLELDLASKP